MASAKAKGMDIGNSIFWLRGCCLNVRSCLLPASAGLNEGLANSSPCASSNFSCFVRDSIREKIVEYWEGKSCTQILTAYVELCVCVCMYCILCSQVEREVCLAKPKIQGASSFLSIFFYSCVSLCIYFSFSSLAASILSKLSRSERKALLRSLGEMAKNRRLATTLSRQLYLLYDRRR